MSGKNRNDQEALAFIGLAAANATKTKSGRSFLSDVAKAIDDNKLNIAAGLLGLPKGSTAGEIRAFSGLPIAGAIVGAGAFGVLLGPAATVGALAFGAIVGAKAAIDGAKVVGLIFGITERIFGDNNGGGSDRDQQSSTGNENTDTRGQTGQDRGFPILLDLDRDGSLDLVSDGQGGWAGPSDGFLAIDADGSGAIDQPNEIAFTEWDENARTDLEGLALAFDTNNDGKFNAQDERFAEFSVWQDGNGDRVSDPGELRSLEEAGISSIDLSGVPYEGEPVAIQEKAGNQVFGVTTVAYDDGTFGIAGDVALAAGEEVDGPGGVPGEDASDIADGDAGDAPGGSSDAVDQLAAEVASLTSKVDQLVSKMAAFQAKPGGSCWSRNDRIDHPTLTLVAGSQAA